MRKPIGASHCCYRNDLRNFLKKMIFILCMILTVFSLTACKQAGKTDAVALIIGESNKFSEEQINDAVNCVKEKFKDFEGCNLTKLLYDEEKSDNFIEGYLKNGKGSVNGVKAEDVIVLLSDFDVDSSGGDGSLNPNSTYRDWNWILFRDIQTGNWKVDDWGY